MKIETGFVIEVELPDGYHWFVGVGNHPLAEQKGIILPMNCFSPYPEDALIMDNEEKATQVNEKIIPDANGYVVSVEKANFNLGYKKLPDGNFQGCKRMRNLQVGESFRRRENGSIYKAIRKENDGKMFCIVINNDRNSGIFIKTDSDNFIYPIFAPVNVEKLIQKQ